MSLSDGMERLTRELRQAHQARGRSLAETRAATAAGLSRDRRERLNMATAQRQRLAAHLGRLKGMTTTALERHDHERRAMATAQRQQLREHRRRRVVQRKELARQANARRRAMRADVHKAQQAWRRLAEMMERGGAAAPAARPAAPRAAREPREAPPAAEAAESLTERVMTYLASQPEGAKLTEIQEALGAARFKMVHALRELLEAGRVRKDEEAKRYLRT